MQETKGRSALTSEGVPAARFRRHFSPFLRWIWHLQDFSLDSVGLIRDDFRMVGQFTPKFSLLVRVACLRRGSDLRLGLPTSVRLANHAAIVASGLLLDRPRKEGDVIADSFNIKCSEPIHYNFESRLPIEIEIHALTESARFFVYHAQFSLGSNGQHSGRLVHYYTKPGS